MKEGDCMDMNGKMDKCDLMKKPTKMKTKKHTKAMTYTCPMHPEVTSDKPGKHIKASYKAGGKFTAHFFYQSLNI